VERIDRGESPGFSGGQKAKRGERLVKVHQLEPFPAVEFLEEPSGPEDGGEGEPEAAGGMHREGGGRNAVDHPLPAALSSYLPEEEVDPMAPLRQPDGVFPDDPLCSSQDRIRGNIGHK